MSESKTESQNQTPRTLSDSEIVKERRLPRRTFLSTGCSAVAGIVGVVAGARAAAAQDDPDKPHPDDKSRSGDKPKRDDNSKEEERRREQERRRREGDNQKSDDRPRPDDTHRADDPHA